MGDIATMYRSFLATFGALLLVGGSAHAANCPPFPPPVVKFVPLPSEVARGHAANLNVA